MLAYRRSNSHNNCDPSSRPHIPVPRDRRATTLLPLARQLDTPLPTRGCPSALRKETDSWALSSYVTYRIADALTVCRALTNTLLRRGGPAAPAHRDALPLIQAFLDSFSAFEAAVQRSVIEEGAVRWGLGFCWGLAWWRRRTPNHVVLRLFFRMRAVGRRGGGGLGGGVWGCLCGQVCGLGRTAVPCETRFGVLGCSRIACGISRLEGQTWVVPWEDAIARFLMLSVFCRRG